MLWTGYHKANSSLATPVGGRTVHFQLQYNHNTFVFHSKNGIYYHEVIASNSKVK